MRDFYFLHEVGAAMAEPVILSEGVRLRMQKSVDFLNRYLKEAQAPVYGINTGFGSLQNVEISAAELNELQENLLITHAAGVGALLSEELTLSMMWLKLLNMSKGYSGIRLLVFERLALMFNERIIPCVNEQGSLGASGDLAPLAQMSLPLIGKGRVRVNGQVLEATDWLKSCNLDPLILDPKEALTLINGTQFMLAHALVAYWKIEKIEAQLPWICGLSIDAFDCRLDPFHPAIHAIRPHNGQIRVAAEIRQVLTGSPRADIPKKQVQDPYSFRCIPQVHGASYDALEHCFSVWETELNAVTDNPNVFEDEACILSGGNFHGQPLALTLDYAAIAIAELANIAERRLYLLVSGQRDLSPYLAEIPGTDSGYMITQYSAASLVSQNKQLCTPASVDSIVSSNGQEDHVSMGANAATKLLRVIENTQNVLAMEWLCGVKAHQQRTIRSSEGIEIRVHAFLSDGPLAHRKVPMTDLIERSYRYCWLG